VSGHIVKEIHQCVKPEIKPKWGDGTQWLCGCGQTWEVIMTWGKQSWLTDKDAYKLKVQRGEIPKIKRRWFKGKKA
jgi:hypothetical protein